MYEKVVVALTLRDALNEMNRFKDYHLGEWRRLYSDPYAIQLIPSNIVVRYRSLGQKNWDGLQVSNFVFTEGAITHGDWNRINDIHLILKNSRMELIDNGHETTA